MSEAQESQSTQALSDIEKDLAARVIFRDDGLGEIMSLLGEMAIQEDKTIRTFTVPACNAEG